MRRDVSVQLYTTEENRQWVKDRAEVADQSISDYCHEVLEAHIDRVTGDSQYERYGTDTQLEVLMEDIREELTTLLTELQSDVGEDLNYMQSIRTAYVIAIWELMKEDYTPSQRRLAMKFAGEHVGQGPGPVPAAVTADDVSADTTLTDTMSAESASGQQTEKRE